MQQKNIPFIKELLPIIANSLTTNTKETYQSLLTNWTTNYPQWDDKARWDRTKLELYLKAYETPPRSNSISEEVEELKLEIENWQKKYQVVRQQVTIKSKEWSQANARINTEVTKAIRSTTAKFASFVNPNDAISLEKAAKDKLHMVTPAELEAEVNKSLIPLKEWQETFPKQSAQEVKQKQKQLITELTPWQNTFKNQTAEQVQEEIETITAAKKQARLDRKAMELEKNNYQEEVERMEEEVRHYYQEYQIFLDLSSQQRERIDQLEEQIYSLGQTPVAEPDFEEEDTQVNLGAENAGKNPLSPSNDSDSEENQSVVEEIDNQDNNEQLNTLAQIEVLNK